jgi:hypothetical protein
MDTRTKIVRASDAARIAASGATVVSGYFDPLLASHADRLEELKRDGKPLLVIIALPEKAILPPRARAELVAGLRVVDYVTEMADGIQAHYRLEEEDERRLDDLVAHVHVRNAIAET